MSDYRASRSSFGCGWGWPSLAWTRDAGVFGVIGSMALAASAVGAYSAEAGMGGAFISGLALALAVELASRSGLRGSVAWGLASLALLLGATILWAHGADASSGALLAAALLLAAAGIAARIPSYPRAGFPRRRIAVAGAAAGAVLAAIGGVGTVLGAGWAALLWPLGSILAGAGEYLAWAGLLAS